MNKLTRDYRIRMPDERQGPRNRLCASREILPKFSLDSYSLCSALNLWCSCARIGSSESDAKLCSVEAEAAITEVAFGVKEIRLASDKLPCTDSIAYLNLTTLEGEPMCVEISVKGFCPVGRRTFVLRWRTPLIPDLLYLETSVSKKYVVNFSESSSIRILFGHFVFALFIHGDHSLSL
ncbi:unnamed protein product [Echinostoma caproni]|uniref:DUF727 domain-containing protein n=1 Tax=Echinostoma caproni TaxID=27848 RepID=A0A183AWY9_9TREM|nr:unnamed protein product [Echinostoma caproni]